METLLSVGIDVGTTSTHMTVSRIAFSNLASFRQAPRLAITKREIVHCGRIHFTPVQIDGQIDAARIHDLISEDYNIAGITANDIRTGAVIVTGETAKRQNAREVAMALARFAGDFVVASAGPNLESVLAARGSGAVRASELRNNTVCNVDIGGGTVNAAIYRAGQLIDCACLGLGGRFCSLDPSTLQLHSVHQAAVNFFLENQLPVDLQIGTVVSYDALTAMADVMGSHIISFLTEREFISPLLVTAPLRHTSEIDEYWFTGGVAELMLTSPAHIFQYGDLGGVLGKRLVDMLHATGLRYQIPNQPIRATVIGAGTYSMQLSGCTIEIDKHLLPLTNLPIIRPFRNAYPTAELEQLIRDELNDADIDWRIQPVGIVLDSSLSKSYRELKMLAGQIAGVFQNLSGKGPLVVLMEQDIAAAFGLLLRAVINNHDVVVIDGVDVRNGDFIDIGQPILSSQLGQAAVSLPIVIKTLVFQH